MHVARQKAGESVLEFAGRLCVLADKGYPSLRLLVTNLSRVFSPLPSSSNFSQISTNGAGQRGETGLHAADSRVSPSAPQSGSYN